jgi:hypothetical protein
LRLAAVGAALSIAVAAGSPAVLAADRPVSPSAPVASPATTPRPPQAADDAAAVDDELIEFLGGIGDTEDDGDWLDFLTNTDIDKVAKRGSKTAPRGE